MRLPCVLANTVLQDWYKKVNFVKWDIVLIQA